MAGAPAAYSETEEDAAIIEISTKMAVRSPEEQKVIAAEAAAEAAAEKDAMDDDGALGPEAATRGVAITWSDLKDIMGKIWKILKRKITLKRKIGEKM